MEVDYLPGKESLTKQVLSAYDFDYIIGSVHFWLIGILPIRLTKRYDQVDIDELYVQYFTLIQQLATSGLFDIVGHLDVIKVFLSFAPRLVLFSGRNLSCFEKG